ncbi:MAG: histidine phosphatase family protein [Deltaproteobacteria bacterium]|nr:histidine phosphatase family protein [Deltaproteobacteria bacterium]
MKLVFVRHAIAVEKHPDGDGARELTAEGRKKALEVCRAVAGMDLGIERILTSPLQRSVQTAQILREVLKLPKAPEETKALLPEAEPQALTAILKSAKAECIALVGHEPHISRYTAWTVGGGKFDVRKCGVVVLEGAGVPGAGQGALAGLFAPRHLRPLV